jgi:protocatechuate 3,4-dioxygenase beta subunit
VGARRLNARNDETEAPLMSDPVSAELAAMLSSCTVCRPWAEQDEGPYHRDAQPLRRDIVEDRVGVPLHLGIRLIADGKPPPSNAVVEIWQCDALGRYSGFPPPASEGGAVTAANAPRSEYLADQMFLRGRQRTDADGMVEFGTIYPGWYPGRTVHIHLMVHIDDTVLTSQLYFPDDVSDQVLARAPYAERPGRDTTNATDEIFPTGGEPAVLDLMPFDGCFRGAIGLVVPTTGARS